MNIKTAPKYTMRRLTPPGLEESWYESVIQTTNPIRFTGVVDDGMFTMEQNRIKQICEHVRNNRQLYVGAGKWLDEYASPEAWRQRVETQVKSLEQEQKVTGAVSLKKKLDHLKANLDNEDGPAIATRIQDSWDASLAEIPQDEDKIALLVYYMSDVTVEKTKLGLAPQLEEELANGGFFPPPEEPLPDPDEHPDTIRHWLRDFLLTTPKAEKAIDYAYENLVGNDNAKRMNVMALDDFSVRILEQLADDPDLIHSTSELLVFFPGIPKTDNKNNIKQKDQQKAIQRRLREMESNGLVLRPRGRNGGWQATDEGVALVERRNSR